jgi:hypothetical protein
MANVDFITDEELRASLVSDLAELNTALEHGSFKSVHVLAGSVVEAILIDYLMAFGHVTKAKALEMDLGKAIQLCRDKGVLSARTADLSSVIRSYRNLIHPGRVVRLQEKVTPSTAQVARSLVDIVLEEVEAERSKTYGLTAEQILGKLERDSGVVAILSHLLKETKPAEIRKLLLRVLPAAATRYANDLDEAHHMPATLSAAFRAALKQADDAVRAELTERFAEILRTEGSTYIYLYGKFFFRAPDLAHATPASVLLIRDHLLSRLKSVPIRDSFRSLQGLGPYLRTSDVNAFVDPLVRSALGSESEREDVFKFLRIERATTKNDFDAAVEKRLETLRDNFNEREARDSAEIAQALITIINPLGGF